MINKLKLISLTFCLIFVANNSYSEEEKNIRQQKQNSILLGLEFLPMIGYIPNFTIYGTPKLSIEYNRSLDKNFSAGLNLKTIIFYNEGNIFGRYYLDYLSTKNSFFYVQGDLGYGFTKGLKVLPDSQTYTHTFLLTPSIGYEIRLDNGFTANADISQLVGFNLNEKNNFNLNTAFKVGAKLGYSF